MNTERDKFLAEAIGGFWHYSVRTGAGNECSCGKWWSECVGKHPDFSTWEGFGKLWEWAEKQDWFWSGVFRRLDHQVKEEFINPDNFANAVYTYLKEKENDPLHQR